MRRARDEKQADTLKRNSVEKYDTFFWQGENSGSSKYQPVVMQIDHPLVKLPNILQIKQQVPHFLNAINKQVETLESYSDLRETG